MELMLRGAYLHPNGQMPAYEWNFSDVNPPVHAWATLFLHRTEQALRGEADVDFLKSAFNKLLLNFTWWVNRKDRFGKNVFEGGFLGLDNIGVFDRSAPLPTGGHLEQADGTAWMALFSQNMLELAVELAAHDPTYEDMVLKFAEHFLYIAAAMNQPGADGMWDEEDGFYYDLLRLARRQRHSGSKCARWWDCCPLRHDGDREVAAGAHPADDGRCSGTLAPDARTAGVHSPHRPGHFGVAERGIIALVNPERLRRILSKMLDENEFLSPYGIRSLSKFHEQTPVRLPCGRPGVPGGLPAGRVEHRHVRRQLQLAGTDLDAGERHDHPGAPEFLSLLRRQLQDRMPHRVRQDDEPLRGLQGDRGSAEPDLPAE